MNKRDPQVGDRVRIYGTVPCEVNSNGRAYKRGDIGKITFVMAEDELHLRTKFGDTVAHPKQIRFLKPKVKCGLRKVGYAYTTHGICSFSGASKKIMPGDTHVMFSMPIADWDKLSTAEKARYE